MTPNLTAPAVGRRLQCTWCTAAKRPDFLANGQYNHPFCHLACQKALDISCALWPNQLTSRNFSKSQSSTPKSVPTSRHRCYSNPGAMCTIPGDLSFIQFLGTRQLWGFGGSF